MFKKYPFKKTKEKKCKDFFGHDYIMICIKCRDVKRLRG